MRYVLIIILVYFTQGCNDRNAETSGIIKKEKMQAVLWDFIQADVFTKSFTKKDSLKNDTIENVKLQQQIFAIHNITKEAFYKSYAYYNRHYDIMRTMLDSISAKAERERGKMVPDQHPFPVQEQKKF